MKIRILIVTILFGMAMILGACGDKAEDADRSGNPDVQISQDGQSGTIKEGDSSLEYGKSMEWPKELMADLPEPKATITAVVKDDSTKACTAAFAEFAEDDAEAYVAKLKELGYESGMESADAESMIFNGESDNGAVVFVYNVTAKEGTISYESKSEEDMESSSEE